MTPTVLETVRELESKLLRHRNRDELSAIYGRAKIKLDGEDLESALGKIAVLNFELGRAAGESGLEFFRIGPANAEIERLCSELTAAGMEVPANLRKREFNFSRANDQIRELRSMLGRSKPATPRADTAAPAKVYRPNGRGGVRLVDEVSGPRLSSCSVQAPSTPATLPKQPSLQQIALAVYGEAAMEILAQNLRSDAAIDRRLERNFWCDGLEIPGEDPAALAAKHGPRPQLRGLRGAERHERQRRIDKLFSK